MARMASRANGDTTRFRGPTRRTPHGRRCYCGKRGCIETFLSGPGMTTDHARVAAIRPPPPEIVEAAAGGDAAADATLCRYERRMARALAGVINVLDPGVIVLGGGMSNIERLYATSRVYGASLSSHAGRASQARLAEPEGSAPRRQVIVETRLLRACHGDASGVRGAAWLWPAAPTRLTAAGLTLSSIY